MSLNRSDDNVTDQRLRLLVGLVVVLGLCAMAGLTTYALRSAEPLPHPLALLGLSAALMIANRVKVLVRVKASTDATTWGEIPVLVGLTLLPAPWVVFCAVVAMILLRCLNRLGLQKSVFGVAKEALTTDSAAAVFIAFGVRPELTGPPFPVLPIVLALITFVLVDHLVFVPVLVTATGNGVREVALRNWTGDIICVIGELVTALLVVAVLATGTNPLLLLGVPSVVLCIHLWQSLIFRSLEER